MNTLILQASARSYGNTYTVVSYIQQKIGCSVIDLSTKKIYPYTYDNDYPPDDFLSVMNRIVQADLIILASPIYWYSMSGIMKIFFDRLADCLTVQKHIGRKLKGKAIAVVSCGSKENRVNSFFDPFKSTAQYLGLHYCGDVHAWIEKEHLELKAAQHLDRFSQELISVSDYSESCGSGQGKAT